MPLLTEDDEVQDAADELAVVIVIVDYFISTLVPLNSYPETTNIMVHLL